MSQRIPMVNYDLVPSFSGAPYRVHDVIADIFCVDVTDAQADTLLGLCPCLDGGDGKGAEVVFADCICHHFVGRGLPWAKEENDEEARFWSSISSVRERFLEFITA